LTSPAKSDKLKAVGAITRWDELVLLHQVEALQIHSTGTFLPFHRYFVHVHEFLLAECGWTGGHPYWNEALDAGHFTSSPLFNPVHGFGGSGVGEGNCVPDGPFVNLTVNIGPGFTDEPRCVNRLLNDTFSIQTNQTYVDAALSPSNYSDAWVAIYMGPHLFGHIALAMMDGNSITSPGDPLFFMHHGFVDKMWWDWQARNLSARLVDMNGPNAQSPDIGFLEFPGGIEEESAMWGKPNAAMLAITPDPTNGDNGGNVTTLNHVMSSLGILPDVRIKDVMNIQGGYLCYEYV
jgi:tyrosinase